MKTSVESVIQTVRSMSEAEREAVFQDFLDDPELFEDLLDLALSRQALAEGGETVTLDEYLAGKRTY